MTILFAGNEVDAFEAVSLSEITRDTDVNRYDSDFAVNGGLNIEKNAILEANFTDQTEGWLHFQWAKPADNNGQDNPMVELQDAATSQRSVWMELNSGDFEFWYRPGFDTKINPILTTSIDQLYTIDIHWLLHASAGVVEFYIDGVLTRFVSGDTLGNDVTNIGKVKFYGLRTDTSGITSQQVISEVIVATTSTIGMRVATVSPSGAGTTSDWAGAYTDVDDLVVANDADLLSSVLANDVTTFAATNLSVAAAAMEIEAVVECCRARNAVTGPQNLQHAMRSGTTNYFGSSIAALSTAYSGHVNIRETDPDTATAWTSSGVDALEIGVKSIT